MPLPMDTLFRVQLSPDPTHTILWLEGSMVTAPIDCTSCWSNTDLKVVVPLMDFHTPPLAEPAKTVILPFSSTPSMAAMRPLMAAEPMLRALRPEIVPESYFTGRFSWAKARKFSRRRTTMHPGNVCNLRGRVLAFIIFILHLLCFGLPARARPAS